MAEPFSIRMISLTSNPSSFSTSANSVAAFSYDFGFGSPWLVTITAFFPGLSRELKPASINEVRFLDRSKSIYDNEVRVTTAVPTVEEAEALFGTNLAEKEIQPVWVKVENHGDRIYYLVTTAVDPNYFSPNEATFAVGGDAVGHPPRLR